MKTKIILLAFVVMSISTSAIADIPLKFNLIGEFIPPDTILQQDAKKQYKQGQLNASLKTFKRSAKFGNDLSKYMIALIYFEKKNWTTGYAWLRMVKEPIDNRDDLISKFSKLLTKQELTTSDTKLEYIKTNYNDNISFLRRDKWQKSQTFVGTRIPGILHNLGKSNLNLDVTANNSQNALSVGKIIRHYILEYSPEANVIPGEIIETKN